MARGFCPSLFIGLEIRRGRHTGAPLQIAIYSRVAPINKHEGKSMSIDWYHYITDVEKVLEDVLGPYCLAHYKKRHTKDYLYKLKTAVNENSNGAKPNPT